MKFSERILRNKHIDLLDISLYCYLDIYKMRCLIMKKDTEKEVETCDCCEVHENLLQIVNETLPEEN